MVPRIDRHIDLQHALTHDINAEDEILLTSNPSRDQQVVRKAYADSIAGSGVSISGTWNPITPIFQIIDFAHPSWGSLKGGKSGVGTRSRHLVLYSGTNSYAKVGWRYITQGSPTYTFGSIGVQQAGLNRLIFTPWVPSFLNQNGSIYAGIMIGHRLPYIGSDNLPKAGSPSFGIAYRGTTLWGLYSRGATREKRALGKLGTYIYWIAWGTPGIGMKGVQWWRERHKTGIRELLGSVADTAVLSPGLSEKGSLGFHCFAISGGTSSISLQLAYMAHTRTKNLAG